MKIKQNYIVEKFKNEGMLDEYKSFCRSNPYLNLQLNKSTHATGRFCVYRLQSSSDTLVDANAGSLAGTIYFMDTTERQHGYFLTRYEVTSLRNEFSDYRRTGGRGKSDEDRRGVHTPDPDGQAIGLDDNGMYWYYFPKNGAYEFEKKEVIDVRKVKDESLEGRGREWILDNFVRQEPPEEIGGEWTERPYSEDDRTNFNFLSVDEKIIYLLELHSEFFGI